MEPATRPHWALAACCAVAFAKLVDPQLWMMGLNIPESAFGAAWQPYRNFSGINVLVLMPFLLFGGLLGDVIGRRRVMLIGTAVALAANVFGALALSPGWFMAGRALEGFGSALAFPMTLAVLQGVFTGRARPVALLLYTFVTALAGVLSLSALAFTVWLGWRATLILPICAGCIGLVLSWRYVPESRVSGAADVHRGIVIAGWSLLLLAGTLGVLTWRQESTLQNPVTTTAVIIGAVGGVVLALSRRARAAGSEPHVDWHRRHALTTMVLVAVVLTLGLSGYLSQVYNYLTVVQGAGLLGAALALAPVVLASVLLARPAARLTMRAAPQRMIVGGLALMGVALILTAAVVGPSMSYWWLVVPMAMFGFAFLVAQTAWSRAFLSAIPEELIGASAGTSKAAAQAGTWLGTALLATLVLRYGLADFTERLQGVGLSADQVALATSAVGVALRADVPANQSTDPLSVLESGLLLATYHESYTVGMSTALLWAAGVCVGTAVLAWIVLRAPATPAELPVRGQSSEQLSKV